MLDALAEEATSAVFDKTIGLDLSEASVDRSVHKVSTGGAGTGKSHVWPGSSPGTGRSRPTEAASASTGSLRGQRAHLLFGHQAVDCELWLAPLQQ